MSGPVSLRDRLKQYQGLKENQQQKPKSYVPPSRTAELDFISKTSPLRTSLRKIEVGQESWDPPLKVPDLNESDSKLDAEAKGDAEQSDTPEQNGKPEGEAPEGGDIVEEEVVEEEILEEEVEIEEEIVEEEIIDEEVVEEEGEGFPTQLAAFQNDEEEVVFKGDDDDSDDAWVPDKKLLVADTAQGLTEEPQAVFQALDDNGDEPQAVFQAPDDNVRDIETGESKPKAFNPRAGLPPKNPNTDKYNMILCFLVLVGLLAVAAIVLPFVINYNDDNGSPGPTPSPVAPVAPTPDPLPTIFKTEAPTPTPVPTITPLPTEVPPPTGTPVPTGTSAPTVPLMPSQAPTTSRLGQFIEVFLVPVSGEEVFEDRNSPQYRAAEYMADEDEYIPSLSTIEELADRYAATTFYFATGGDEWNQCSRGDGDCRSPWLVDDHCDWNFLACNGDGRLSSIAFGENGLNGSIPLEIWLLQDLEDLVITNNKVGGTLPKQFGSEMTNMKRLVLEANELSGSVPDGYLQNSPLELMLLGGNQLSSPFPRNFGNPVTLKELDLGGNKYSGSIPSELGEYVELSSLSLSGNNLGGTIPETLFSLRKLEQLFLDNNPLLTGRLSPMIGELALLQGLRVGHSNLIGSIPDELYELDFIEEVDLSGANFRGPLSASFSNLAESLELLYLDNNQFTGTVPETFGRLTNLSVLNLHKNQITGIISDEICALNATNLEELTADCKEVSCSCCTECFSRLLRE